MRNQPPFFRHTAALATAAILAFGTSHVTAQEASPATTISEPKLKPGATESPYDLEIKNGELIWKGKKRADNTGRIPATLDNVVEQLRGQYPEGNFIIGPGLGEMTIADLKLRDTSVDEKLDAINIASGKSVIWSKNESSSKPGHYQIVLSEAPAWANAAVPLEVEAFGIGDYLDGVAASGSADKDKLVENAINEIRKVVDETLMRYEEMNHELNPTRKRPQVGASLQFHRGANLVVVIGEPESVMVAAKLIGALPGVRQSGGPQLTRGHIINPQSNNIELKK